MKAMVDGKEYELVPVDVVKSEEPWNTYILEDGSRLKSKSVVVRICKLKGSDGQFLKDKEGKFAYRTENQQIVIVE